jgi:hypothetical protein
MLFTKKLAPNYMGLILGCIFSIGFSIVGPLHAVAQDSTFLHKNDTLPFPIHDRRGDLFLQHLIFMISKILQILLIL